MIKQYNMPRKKKTLDDAKAMIQDMIDNLNNSREFKISFVEFVDHDWIGRNTKFKLLREKHKRIEVVKFRQFQEFGWRCDECILESQRFSEEVAYSKVYNKISLENNNGKFIEFLGFDRPWCGTKKTKVILRCKKHNYTSSIYFSVFMREGWNCIKCTREKFPHYLPENIAIERINDKIKSENNLGKSIEFLGFKESWHGLNTKLILKCRKHNYIGDKTTYESFLYSGWNCPVCTKNCGATSVTEIICYNTLLNYIDRDNIESHYEINIKKESSIFRIERSIYVDMKIELNGKIIFIEYDGIQHTKFIRYFHKNYQGFVNQRIRDLMLDEYCRTNNITLLRIPYVDRKKFNQIFENFFQYNLDITTKVEPKLLPILYYG